MVQNITISQQKKQAGIVGLLFLLECLVIVGTLFFFSSNGAFADVVGTPNSTILTTLTIDNVYPEVINITFDDHAGPVTLVANSTKLVYISAIIRDYNGEDDLRNATLEFFDKSTSSYGAADDNNNHYTNETCDLDYTYGDIYSAQANCTVALWYYANNASWNATFKVADNSSYNGYGSRIDGVNALLAVGLPNSLDYGLVNATTVSNEKIINVTNYGNVKINISVLGYASNITDRLAMNCTLGSLKNISIAYQRYNFTDSNTSTSLNITEFNTYYANLTSTSTVRKYLLNSRQSEVVNEATNQTYWRIYVPTGVAGSCQGHLLIGATTQSGT